MASTTPLQVAVLLDLYPPSDTATTHELCLAVPKLLSDLGDHDAVRLYALTSPDIAKTALHQAGLSRDGLDVTVLFSVDKIQAFYLAKQALDALDISDIRLLCLDSQRLFWTNVCDLLFTPVYNWAIQSVPFSVNVTTDDNTYNSSIHITSTVLGSGDEQETLHVTSEWKEPEDLRREAIRLAIQRFLTSLPSLLGEPEVYRSMLIPRGLFVHGYSTRRGGVTAIPPMSSMNLVYVTRKRDSLLVVNENRRRLAKVGGFDHTKFHIVRTEHGHRVWIVGQEQPPNFDGLVTNQRDVTIAAVGADCIPLLLADPVAMVVGAAHAGWKGTVQKVAGCVVQTMLQEFGCEPKDIRVAMGPCVLAGCFSVLPDEAKMFSDIHPSCLVPEATFGSHFIDKIDGTIGGAKSVGVLEESAVNMHSVEKTRDDAQSTNDYGENLAPATSESDRSVQNSLRKGRVAVDLVTTNRLILEREGILPEHIDTSTAFCTRCNPHLFFSCERDGFPFGNQIGFISMPSKYQ